MDPVRRQMESDLSRSFCFHDPKQQDLKSTVARLEISRLGSRTGIRGCTNELLALPSFEVMALEKQAVLQADRSRDFEPNSRHASEFGSMTIVSRSAVGLRMQLKIAEGSPRFQGAFFHCSSELDFCIPKPCTYLHLIVHYAAREGASRFWFFKQTKREQTILRKNGQPTSLPAAYILSYKASVTHVAVAPIFASRGAVKNKTCCQLPFGQRHKPPPPQRRRIPLPRRACAGGRAGASE